MRSRIFVLPALSATLLAIVANMPAMAQSGPPPMMSRGAEGMPQQPPANMPPGMMMGQKGDDQGMMMNRPGMMQPGMMMNQGQAGPLMMMGPQGGNQGMMMNRPGMTQPGMMMGQDQTRPGMMMGPQGGSQGMMHGPGMMRPGGMMGRHCMMQPGMMTNLPGMMGPGMKMGGDTFARDKPYSTDEIARILDGRLVEKGLSALKVDNVEALDETNAAADVVTQKGEMVMRLRIDRLTGNSSIVE